MTGRRARRPLDGAARATIVICLAAIVLAAYVASTGRADFMTVIVGALSGGIIGWTIGRARR